MEKKEAIKILKDFHDESALFSIRTALETLYPELKESEDERIIKILQEGVNDVLQDQFCTNRGVSKEKVLSWLEKQESVNEIVSRCRTSWYNEGKIAGMAEGLTDDEKYQQGWHDALEKQGKNDSQVIFPTFTFDDVLALQCCMETVKKIQEDKDLYEKLEDLHDRVHDAYHLEKQGEQKVDYTTLVETGNGGINALVTRELPTNGYSANEVEPKFKVGDWITNGDYTWKIVEVKPLDYILQSQDGNIVDDTIYHVDEQFNLWFIQDAKDGDVLVASDKSIFIYDGSINENGSVGFHIAFTEDMDIILNSDDGCGWEEKDSCHPSTKEQRDLLFQKMHEAGYEGLQSLYNDLNKLREDKL